MAFTRAYPDLTQDLASQFAGIFRRDGAEVEIREDEGSYTVTVKYGDTPSSGIAGGVVTGTSVTGGELQDLVRALRNSQELTEQQKIVCLAQWIIESNHGKSDLARLHKNYGGLKYRARMQGIATPVDYHASDGVDVYCKFGSDEEFVKGYWHFIASGPYDGWEQFKNDGAAYLRHIAPKYAADPGYVQKVLNRFEAARGLLELSSSVTPPSVVQTGDFRLAVIVGHNSVAQGAGAVAPISRHEFAFNNEVADHMVAEAPHYNLEARRFNRVHQGSYSAEIAAVYRQADDWGADAIVELHFNALNAESNGTEMLFSHTSKRGKELASRLVQEVGTLLKLKLRGGDGLKPLQPGARGYSSVVASKAPTVLTEPFFGSNKNDCVAMAAAGEEALARAYLRAVRDWATNEATA
jgi:hypothetical protein